MDEYGTNAYCDFSNQFEFTIASLVLMGKIISADVKPILEKFQILTGDISKITSSDVSVPMKQKSPEEVDRNEHENSEINSVEPNYPKPPKTSSLVVGKMIAQEFREELFSGSHAKFGKYADI